MRHPTPVSRLTQFLKVLIEEGQENHQKDELAPTGFILKEDNSVLVGEFDFSSSEAKYNSLKNFHKAIIDLNAASAFFVADVWSVSSESTDDVTNYPKDLSTHPDAIETLIAVGCNGKETVLIRVPYTRDSSNNPIYSEDHFILTVSPEDKDVISFTAFFPPNWEALSIESPYLM